MAVLHILIFMVQKWEQTQIGVNTEELRSSAGFLIQEQVREPEE